ncbi:MAG: hypothetical protein KKH72_05370 [Alphaproteobacteria bacterium]|nr:hypothetical protein [Alphaproteobacteria bacterium]
MKRRTFMLATAAAATTLILPARAADDIKLRDLYNKDLSFSDMALANQDKIVDVSGYMAPPLKAESAFFVLTRMPMSFCPFCDSEATWPSDIIAVYARDTVTVQPFNVGIVVTGTLELGTYRDPDLGFVSRVRLTNAEYRRS